MHLSQDLHDRIEADGPSFVPPYPDRPQTPLGRLQQLRVLRKNLIGVFNAVDYATPLIHQRFGRLDVFVANAPEFVKEAFQDQHPAFQAKSPQMRHALTRLLGDGLFVSDGALWAERRRAVAPIVHASRLTHFAPIMIETVAEWQAHWATLGPDAPVDVLAEMAELTAEIISRAIFGRRLGRTLTGQVVAGFSAYQERVDQLDPLSLLGAPDWFPRPQRPSLCRAVRQIHAVIDDIIDRFARGEGDPDAVIAQLFKARDAGGAALDRRAIRNEAIVLFMAGHETTANTLAWAWYLIARSPRVRRKLHRELSEVLGGRAATLEDVAALRFTRAILEETLRLYPPVPMLGRQALASGHLGGLGVPRGAVVLVSPFMLHRRPALWSMPDHFIPERFDDRLAARPAKYAYIPFAIGPRICPGLSFGLTEAILVLATLAQGFDLAPAPGFVPDIQCRLTLRPGATLPMTLRSR